MSANVQITFVNAQLISSMTQLNLDGATYALQASSATSVSGTVSFTSFQMLSGSITFNVTGSPTFNATVNTYVNPASSGTAYITVTNFTGTVNVTWPVTGGGTLTQAATSGERLPLANIASS